MEGVNDCELTDIVRKGVLERSRLLDLDSNSDLQLTRLEGGFLNHAFKITAANGTRAYVVKIYPEYAKFVGSEAPMERERGKRENEGASFFRSLLPECCPLHHFYNPSKNLLCMEYLQGYSKWEDIIMTSPDIEVGLKIIDILLVIHSKSHRIHVGEAEFAALEERFSAFPQQAAFFNRQHFVKPFLQGHRENKKCSEVVRCKLDQIIQEPVVKTSAEQVQREYAVGQGDCCIHGDPHMASFMVSADRTDVKLIDTECTRVGPEAYDVAMLVSNYVLLYHYHQELAHQQAAAAADTEQAKGETPDLDHDFLRVHILDLICITLSRYMEGMNRALGEKFDKHKVWRQILLYMGVWIIAWISGPATLSCLDSQPLAQLNCLNTALRILHKQSLSLDAQDLSKLIHNQG